MRVGIVLLSLGIGGTEKRLATLFKHLHSHTSESMYLVATDRLLDLLRRQKILSGGEETHAVITPTGVSKLPGTFYAGFPSWRRALGRALDEANAVAPFDVLHYGIAVSYFIAPKRYRRPAVVEAVASTHEWHLETMNRAAAKRGAVVNCLSGPIYNAISAPLTSEARARVSRSPGSLLSIRRDGRTAKKPAQVAFVGRLERIKNPLLFLEALAVLKQRGRPFTAVLLGDGRLRPEVDASIVKLGLGGQVECRFHHTPADVLAESLVFVSLQHWDNYPSQALLEAMECECAVVASDVGSTRELITPETGVLVPFDAQRIADAIERLLANPDEARRMGERGRELVRRGHGIETYAAYILELYRRAASRTGEVSPT